MFIQPDFQFNAFYWLSFGLPGIALTTFVLLALKATSGTTVDHILTITVTFIGVFVSVQLLRLLTSRSLEE